MYKQRDNEYHPPMSSDPTGSGTVFVAVAAAANQHGSNDSPFGAPAVAAGSRKRGRDIRGLERFRRVVYGEDGFRRLHAMVSRNPTLMYSPEGLDAARARVAERRQQQQQPQQGVHDGAAGVETEDVFALFEERRAAEKAETTAMTTTDMGDHAENRGEGTPAAPQLPSAAALRDDAELANYHHRQLDSFLRLLYEFNHVSFVKLPMDDTLQLLSRCGKEAVAHVVEYETQVRLKRQARLKELLELQEEKNALSQRRRTMEEAEEARQLAEAEERQAALDLFGLDAHNMLPEGSVGPCTPTDPTATTAVAEASLAAPSVHFAFPDMVKEEEEVKDTDLVETVVGAEMRLPLLGESDNEGGDE